MPRLRRLAAVGDDYPRTGPNHRTVRRSLPAAADHLFGLLADGPTTRDWQGVDVEWTSPAPIGAGSTRTVRGAGQTIEERVLVWQPGQRICLRHERVTLPLAAFAEDYVITPTGPATCALSWHYAYEWSGRAKRILGPLFGVAFALGARRDLKKLANLIKGPDSATESRRLRR